MVLSYDRINRREEVDELFEQLGQVLDRRIQVMLIGGAVLLEQGLKDSTKDITKEIGKLLSNILRIKGLAEEAIEKHIFYYSDKILLPLISLPPPVGPRRNITPSSSPWPMRI